MQEQQFQAFEFFSLLAFGGVMGITIARFIASTCVCAVKRDSADEIDPPKYEELSLV